MKKWKSQKEWKRERKSLRNLTKNGLLAKKRVVIINDIVSVMTACLRGRTHQEHLSLLACPSSDSSYSCNSEQDTMCDCSSDDIIVLAVFLPNRCVSIAAALLSIDCFNSTRCSALCVLHSGGASKLLSDADEVSRPLTTTVMMSYFLFSQVYHIFCQV